MKLGIMQPYFFPYIGYFQLIGAVDNYVIYDDVNYIKGGWVNRNRILLNGKDFFFNLNMVGASPNKKINEIGVQVQKEKMLRTITQAYRKAPYYELVFNLLADILSFENNNLADFLANSIIKTSSYLGIETNFIISSSIKKDDSLKGQDKVLSICQSLGATEYYNAIGGTELYDKESFKKEGIDLHFLKTDAITYNQFDNEFVPYLSIIDVMMFNSQDELKDLLHKYELK